MTSRRSMLLAGISAATVMALTRPARVSAFDTVEALSNLSDLEVFTRMRCSPQGSVTTWWYSGHMLGKEANNPAQPMLSVVGASQSQITPADDGSVIYNLVEAGYYGDVHTQSIVDGTVTNPLNDQLITPEHYLSRQKIQFFPNLSVRPVNPIPPSVNFTGRITKPDIKGGKVWMAEELFVQLPAGNERPPRIANSLANFEANVKDVIAGGTFVPATFEYTTWNSFRPWMKMGNKSGAIMMRLNSTKLRSWTELPSDLTSRIASDHPATFDVT